MARRKRKSKREANKRPRSPTIVSPLRKIADITPLPPGVAELDPDKTVITLKAIFTEAPAGMCFDILKRQLEEPHQWDSVIVNVWPVSNIRGAIGATSQVTLNLGGRKLASLAVICRYHLNRAISWVLSEKPKVREDWRLEQKPHGTTVHVNFALELKGWPIGRFLYKLLRHKKVENDLDRMLVQLKETVEITSHD